MFAYKVLKIPTFLMIFFLGYLLGEFLFKKYGKDNDKKFVVYARGILLYISSIMFIWLLFNKELFHWNYDIATGEPVDHYSTYGRCILYTVIALVSNIIGIIVCLKQKRCKNKLQSDCSWSYTMVEFRKISEFPRGTLYDILQDAYSYDARNKEIWDENWHESDDFFYDNSVIADKYGLVTCIDDYPIGFVTWDPRNAPEYVEIGHNGIRSSYKRKGYGHLQLQEAIRRIRSYDGLKRIIVWTNSNLVAPRNYESVGFKLYDRKMNDSESAYTGDYLYYEMRL